MLSIFTVSPFQSYRFPTVSHGHRTSSNYQMNSTVTLQVTLGTQLRRSDAPMSALDPELPLANDSFAVANKSVWPRLGASQVIFVGHGRVHYVAGWRPNQIPVKRCCSGGHDWKR
jgi:hypothetical protein